MSAIHHDPLPRAAQTAELIGSVVGGPAPRPSEAAGDYLPYLPEEDGLLPAPPGEASPRLAREALELFTGIVTGDKPRHELVVTHNFLIAWLLRDALDAPERRWIGLNHCNAALTVIRYAPGRPPSVLVYNDMAHLPPNLRWTGFPAELRVP